MGLYLLACPHCQTVFNWFSGSADQLCPGCRSLNNTKEKTMDHQQLHMDALNKVISTQNELITFLKNEIQRLSQQPPYPFPTITGPLVPGVYPNTLPFIGAPGTPGNPYTITCADVNPTDFLGGSVNVGGTIQGGGITVGTGSITSTVTFPPGSVV
jgi:phage FluMu protein Com